MLVYTMRDTAEDILCSFGLSDEHLKSYEQCWQGSWMDTLSRNKDYFNPQTRIIQKTGSGRCLNQTAITFDLYFQSLDFVAELIRIKMVPKVLPWH